MNSPKRQWAELLPFANCLPSWRSGESYVYLFLGLPTGGFLDFLDRNVAVMSKAPTVAPFALHICRATSAYLAQFPFLYQASSADFSCACYVSYVVSFGFLQVTKWCYLPVLRTTSSVGRVFNLAQSALLVRLSLQC